MVPANMTWTRSRPISSSCLVSSAVTASDAAPPPEVERRSFICGTLSPVSEASFTTAEPRSSRQSHGTTSSGGGTRFLPGGGVAAGVATAVDEAASVGEPSAVGLGSTGVAMAGVAAALLASEMRSPGSRSVVERSVHWPWRKTKRLYGLALIWLSVLSVLCRWKTDVDSSARMVKMLKMRKPYETASRSQSADVKSWKMTSGESSCSTYKSTKRGVATERMLVPYLS